MPKGTRSEKGKQLLSSLGQGRICRVVGKRRRKGKHKTQKKGIEEASIQPCARKSGEGKNLDASAEKGTMRIVEKIKDRKRWNRMTSMLGKLFNGGKSYLLGSAGEYKRISSGLQFKLCWGKHKVPGHVSG